MIAVTASSGPPTIAFDVSPGSTGPGRYVAALARGLESEGWSAVFPLQPQGADGEQATEAETGDGTPIARRKARSLVRTLPRCIRYVAGFAKNSWQIARQLTAQRIDLFHAQNTGCEESPVGGRFAGRHPVVGTLHIDATYDPRGTRRRPLERSLQWLSNRCLHQAIAVSAATKEDWARKANLPASRIAVVHNGIDPDKICRRYSAADARAEFQLPASALVVGALGRLDRVKGFEYLIEAAALLSEEHPQLMLAVAGDGPLADELKSLAIEHGIANRVRFVGHSRDIDRFLDACDLFAIPSLSEALPFALLEAMAHELPAIGTSVGGIPEVIVPLETGFVVPPRDGEALAAALRPLLASASLRQRLGRDGRERVIKHFHEAAMVTKTLDIYRSLLPRHCFA